MKRNFFLFMLLFFIAVVNAFSQNTHPKNYFDKSGKASIESMSYSFRQESDTAGYFRSYYAVNNKLFFEGRIQSPSAGDENKNLYTGLCTWYYKNGNVKQIRSFNAKGEETGISKYYYESGKIWKEVEFQNGKVAQNSFVEYNEDGTKSKLFEENFDNNLNEWDLYLSDKSSASISAGVFEIISTSKEGTSRYINHTIESDEYTIEAIINIKDIKENDRVGIIYGFKDWQNYNYFAISKKNIFIGSMYEGVKSTEADAMFASSINPLDNNVIKILCSGDKTYFSINGEIQYNSSNHKLFGNNVGFVLGGNTKLKIEKLVVKSIGVSGAKSITNATDQDVKGTGSGIFFGSNGYIITNYHVIENSNKFVVEITQNAVKKNYKAEIVTQDKENDLAILKIKDDQFSNLPPLKYSFKENGQLDVGGTVFTIGYPHALTGMGKDAKFTDGKISAKTGYDGAINSFQSTIPVQPGNSGGPVFNENGQLIGVINASIKNTDNVSYAIKLYKKSY
ncbi:MAG: trypsin-like peptidase domain-containing protein [Bacteroidetes bacterium]|nr:trypsin-like peptidase domain-containing protein [Bacteroidota bacterium]